jgi:hypothetical protein
MHRFCHSEAPQCCLKRISLQYRGNLRPRLTNTYSAGSFRRMISPLGGGHCASLLQDTLQGCRSIFGLLEFHVSWKTHGLSGNVGKIASHSDEGYSVSLRYAPHFTHNIDIRKTLTSVIFNWIQDSVTPQSKHRSVLRPAASYLTDALSLVLVGAMRLVSLPIRRIAPRSYSLHTSRAATTSWSTVARCSRQQPCTAFARRCARRPW